MLVLNQSTSHFCRRGCIKNYNEGQLFDRFGLGYKQRVEAKARLYCKRDEVIITKGQYIKGPI